MEEQKLLKRKKKALSGSNRKQLGDICFELGDFYNGKTKYERARAEYTECASIFHELGQKLENARAHRMIGEMCMLLAEFEKALKHEEIYLSIARELENKVEEQRALATLGRAFLLQGQSLGDTEEAKTSLKAAEKAFMKSIVLCEKLKCKVNNQELMDMRARLLLNIGVVQEHLGTFHRAIEFLQKAINICKSHDLYDLLYQCYVTEGLLHSHKQNDNAKALSLFNLALDVAGRLDNKIAKQSEALSLKAGILCKMSDFYSAKSILMKAWKLKTPDSSDREEIEKNLKTVAAICYTEDLLITSDSNDHEKMKKLFEKLGDGACSLKSYQKGIDYYLKMLEHAEKNGDTGKQMIPIYVSLYRTYQDIKNYKSSLVYQKKELEVLQDDPNEAFTSLIQVAEISRLAGAPQEEVEKVYEQVREEARKTYNEKGEAKAIRLLSKYHREMKNEDKVNSLESELLAMGSIAVSSGESSSDDSEDDNNTPNIGDEICLETLTDISDDDNEENDKPQVARKRGKGFSIKKNTKGETQLHQACISGNTLLVTRLLSQGHPVNVRDNAGWLPLHEACIHGQKDIVEILLQNGAHVNDRGGSQCDGITPMHDAASNGFLEIVELLLDNGASPSIQNDNGATVLDFLRIWRKGQQLSQIEEIFYETICTRLYKNLDRVREVSRESPLKWNNLPLRNSKLSISPKRSLNMRRNIELSNNDSCDSDDSFSSTHKAKHRNIEDESSNSSIEKIDLNKSRNRFDDSGVKDYKNAMKILRNRFTVTDTDSSQEKQKDTEKRKKGALMEPEEVGEDWLEDDTLPSYSKKRKKQDDGFPNTVKRKSIDSIKSPHGKYDEFTRLATSFSGRPSPETDMMTNFGFLDSVCTSELCDSDSNSMDGEIMHRENIPPTHVSQGVEQVSRIASTENLFKGKKKAKGWKHQTTLNKLGFTRNMTDKSKVHSTSYENNCGSDVEIASNLSLNSIKSLRSFNECSEEPDSTTEQSIQNCLIFDRMRSTTPFSQTSPSKFSKAPSFGGYIPTQPALPPAAVRVRIQDKLLLIPVSLDKMDSLTIGWLCKEVSRRYYNIEGVQPSLNLLTSDGAILADEDPLSLVIGPAELQASITSWNLPPVGDRYIECCAQLKTDIDQHLRNMLESSQATHSLQLPNLGLTSAEVQPVFKSLNHQTNLTQLYLANNSLGNDGLKHLAHCLPSLSQIKVIDLSGNFIDAEGVKSLILLFEKPNSSILQNHLEIDFSYNPLGDVGFKHIMKLSHYIRFKSLNLKACDITSQTSENNQEEINLRSLQVLNLGFNSFSRNFLRNTLISLDPLMICALRLEGLNMNGEFISSFMDNCIYANLSEIDLSRCNLTDADVALILRSLSKCEELHTINLRYNTELTILSLKKLIQHVPSFTNVDLEGCSQIFKYMQESDTQGNWFRENEQCKIKSIKVTADVPEGGTETLLQQFSSMWLNRWEMNAQVDLGMYGQMRLSTK